MRRVEEIRVSRSTTGQGGSCDEYQEEHVGNGGTDHSGIGRVVDDIG